MTQRLSKLAEYLYNNNFEMAIQYSEQSRDGRKIVEEPEDVQLLLAKAYFLNEKYRQAIDLANKLKNSRTMKVVYESCFIEFKAQYMKGQIRTEGLQSLLSKLRRENVENVNKYAKQIEQVLNLVSRRSEPSPMMGRTQVIGNERKEFQKILKQQDDRSLIMEGMPMFLISKKWYSAWKQYATANDKFQSQRYHPGPILQFDIVDNLYNIFFDPRSNKDYTNRYVYPCADYEIIPKKCWTFLKDRYGGIDVKRFNLSYIDKPHEIFTQVHLKRLEIARFDKQRTLKKQYVWVQITKKQNWQGLKNKLATVWDKGHICYAEDGKEPQPVTDSQIFDEIDTIGKKYIYMIFDKGEDPLSKGSSKIEKCGYKKCGKTGDLKLCQCKTIKYCNLDCLKEDWKNHKAKCQLEQDHLRRRPVTFKEFNLEEKDYGGRRGVVGLKNLGNTCYMNSGLQCLSNTKQLTEYFMRDEFKNHINSSNPLGTKGNLACAYAELIRQMWTGTSQSLAPTKLKKKIGQFATQFSGYGQQDSQQFISYLIDGIQEDLNLVKKKQTFEIGDDIKPDQQMSKEREYNDSKRIQSFIRNLMVGQFKSTVICSSCQKISVCFDPYMLITLPIPSNRQCCIYFVPTLLQKGAIKVSIEYSNVTTLRGIARQFARQYNDNFYREIKESVREMVHAQRILFLSIDSDKFEITKIHEADEKISSIDLGDILFFIQIPVTKKQQELMLCEFQLNKEKTTYPRFVKFARNSGQVGKETAIHKALERGIQKGAPRGSYHELVQGERLSSLKNLPFTVITVIYKRKLKLSTFVEGYHEGFNRRLSQAEDSPLSLYDCFGNFSHKQKLEKENTVYCNKCKDHKEATKQMEVYKTNKILVLAFKRFTRHKKITVAVDFPLEGLDIGPYLLSNTKKQPVLYDLYGVINHHGSLYGGHYTAYCQNFLDKRWYEFNDSRVSQIGKNDVASAYSYVLFYRRREK